MSIFDINIKMSDFLITTHDIDSEVQSRNRVLYLIYGSLPSYALWNEELEYHCLDTRLKWWKSIKKNELTTKIIDNWIHYLEHKISSQ